MLIPLAHAGQPPGPHDLWTSWNLDPLLLTLLVVAAVAHARGRRGNSVAGRRRARAFTAAWLAVVVALVSPLEALSSALASAHMVQHVLLVLVAAPLLAVAAPIPALLRGLPPAVARATLPLRRGLPAAVGRGLRQPVVAWLLHVGALWGWHAAASYGAALADPLVHVGEHATFLVTGVLFWQGVAGPHRRSGSEGAGAFAVFALSLQSVLLSALLTFAGEPFYDGYATTTAAWGLTPLEDQRLAGVIMWIPAGAIHLGIGLALLVAWIRSTEAPATASSARTRLDVPRRPGSSFTPDRLEHRAACAERGSVAARSGWPSRRRPAGPSRPPAGTPPRSRPPTGR